ncbi:reprolysin family propeptide-containing metallopeptidase [Methanosarcina barkeri]|uniref:Uncharacterized protein n=1 Tax=Methanosarcina barkeri CM1 TaxID=796385 RepID=A0A0G3CEM7_METBA|nr:reprolysin family propeptide-containing metallopeptidase [Methanosarcina barkeri]AKJ38428.1 hypothetical protein MCM1_1378 [Methanosarcina barkeri CM1]
MNKKYGISAIFATFLIVTVVFVPAVNAATEDSKSDIINNIDFNKKLLDFNDTLNNFETVTTNPSAFLDDAADGQVTLRLLGQKFDLKLQKIHVVSDNATITAADGSISDAPKSYSYNGTVVGKANSSVVLTAGDGVLIGEINVDNESYYIDQTAKKYNNKVVHIVYSSDEIKKGTILAYCTVFPVIYFVPQVRKS